MKLFDANYKIEKYETILKEAKEYIKTEFSNNLMNATRSLDEYKKYKEDVKSFDDVPSYKISSYLYKYVHSINVSTKCEILASKCNLSKEVMSLAGVLHDVGHYTCDYRLHGVKSAEMAKNFLKRYSHLEIKDIEAIGRIIASHYPIEWDENYYKSSYISKEEVVLLEADFWDKNDLISFIEKTRLEDIEVVREKYSKIQKNCLELLNEKEEERDCEYTKGFCECIKKQIDDNEKAMQEYIEKYKNLSSTSN